MGRNRKEENFLKKRKSSKSRRNKQKAKSNKQPRERPGRQADSPKKKDGWMWARRGPLLTPWCATACSQHQDSREIIRPAPSRLPSQVLLCLQPSCCLSLRPHKTSCRQG